MKTKNSPFLVTVTAAVALCGLANAHIVALGWKPMGGGTLQFSALHWHGNQDQDVTLGALIFDGVSYPFTSTLQNTSSISGFSGGLVNAGYATWNPGTGTINTTGASSNDGSLVDDWLIVTISGVGQGSHTVTADSGPGQLTEWTLDGGLDTFDLVFSGGGEIELASTLQATSISVSRTLTSVAASRLFSLRSGLGGGNVGGGSGSYGDSSAAGASPGSSAGSSSYSAKGDAKSPIAPPPGAAYSEWEVYGHAFHVSEDQDGMVSNNQQLRSDTSIDISGASVGVECRFTPNWTAGFAFSASRTDIDIDNGISTDFDSFALVPYVSYFRPSAVANGDFYAGLLYAYADHDYDMKTGNVSDSADGESHQVEFATGLNFRSGALGHGPYATIRWIDGEIDGHNFSAGEDVDYESLATQLGYQVSYPIALVGGTLVPQGRVGWEHEFKEDQGRFAGIPLAELDEDLAVVGAGIGYYANNGWNAILDYEGRFGSDTDSHYIGLKVGKVF